MLNRVDCVRYLGVCINSNVKWDRLITTVVNKTKYLIFVFYKLKYIMNQTQLLQVYYALFHNFATYGIIAWGSAYNNITDTLQVIQNRILKIIFGCNIDKIISKKRPLTIKETFELEAIMFSYSRLRELFLQNNSKTRNRSIPLPACNLNSGIRKHTFIAIKLYNELPNSLKNLQNMSFRSIRTKMANWIRERNDKLKV